MTNSLHPGVVGDAAGGGVIHPAPAADGWFKFAVAVLCLAGALAIFGPLYRAWFLAEIDVNEGWNAYFAQAVERGEALYPAPDQLISNNYPPLSFYVVAGAAPFLGGPIVAGRAISILALLVIGAAIYATLRELECRRWAAGLAALAYLATMSRLYDRYVGMDDPQLLGTAIATLGFLSFTRERSRANPWFIGSILLMVSAGFVKPSLFAMPGTAFVVLLLDDKRAALRFAFLGLVLAGAGLLACGLWFGPDFFFNVFTARPFSLLRGLKTLDDLPKIGIPLLAWCWYLTNSSDGPRRRIINVFCVLAAIESVALRAARDVDYNSVFDLVIALHLALGIALERMGEVPLLPRWPAIQGRTIVILALALRLLLGGRTDAFHAVYSQAYREHLRAAEAATIAEAKRVAAIPGDVACEHPLICYLAGKPFVADFINIPFRVAEGRLPADALDRLYRSGQLTFVPLNPETIVRYR